MDTLQQLSPSLQPATPENTPSRKLLPLLTQAAAADPVEQTACFGRWWLDPQASQIVLSAAAAGFLDVEAGWHGTLESCFAQVVPEDVLMLMSALGQTGAPDRPHQIECEFRIINELDGLRWLRMTSLPERNIFAVPSGVLVDITAQKHAAMRERFSFESTQFLVGTHSVGAAVTKVIQLVCENLGWEWGAYWELEQDQMGAHRLACKHYWHHPDYVLDAFTADSRALRIAPGQGMVGEVWATGHAAWVEDTQNDPDFLRAGSAHECSLRSGYAFPVSYVTPDGRRHSPGVLEFFSSLSRQREAQLPNLSAAIGALIAQTVQRLEQQEYIRRLAQVDDLTGLNNRNHFQDLLDAACVAATASEASFGVLYIDLDRFKPINDAFGHEAGNVVLREFGQRLLQLAPEDCHVGRLGGDEFAIVTGQTGSMARLCALAERVLLAARKPFEYEGRQLAVSASVGISVFPENGWTAQGLLRSSDAAMYRVKQGGRNALGFMNGASAAQEAQQSALAQQVTMEADLHHAMTREEFFLEYQPVYDSFAERMVAVEALIRWRRPNGEIVRPEVFIPIAEQGPLIVQIGRWVVQRACRDLALLHRSGLPQLQLNVNMAASEFISASLPAELAAVVEACGVASQHVCLELTESMVMKQADQVIPVMRTLRQLGFKISLDDFGTGHSSLSRLKKLPISSLKIDRSFIKGLPQDRGDGAIVRTILDLGRHMKLQVIAEGVETDAQLTFLRQFGCGFVQGYVLSRPLPLESLIAAL
jgi:diguanylate cyclase (GGDEF)-like protein